MFDLARDFLADKSLEQKLEYAKSKTTPREILSILAEDENRNVRLYVIKNKHTHPNALHKILENDTDDEVRETAEKEFFHGGARIFNFISIDPVFDYY